MSNALSTSSKNSMLTTFAGLATFASLHSAYPGDVGANEIAGGVPPYARQPITWNPAAAGSLDNNANPLFDVPAATTIAFLGLWNLVAAGTFAGAVPLGGGTPLPFEAEDSTDIFTADQHGLVDGTRVILLDTTGAVLPGGFTEGDLYFVRDSTTDTFKLSLTSGGVAIDVTLDGAGFVQTIVPETFGGQGTYQVTDVDIDLLR